MERAELERAIIGLEELISDTTVIESTIHSFLGDHLSALESLGFDRAISHHTLGDPDRDRIPDFLVVAPDSSVAILDLKRPQPIVERGQDHREVFRAHVTDGIAQLTDYADWFDDTAHRAQLSADLNVNAEPKPDLFLVVGRNRSDSQRSTVRRLEREYARRIRIMTYDDLLGEMRAYLDRSYGVSANIERGLSIFTTVALHEQDRSTPTVLICTRPEAEAHWRLRVAEGNGLILESTTRDGELVAFTVPPSIAQIQDGQPTSIMIQFGSAAGRATAEIIVDGHFTAGLTYPGELTFPTATTVNALRIGASEDGILGTKFELSGFAVFPGTLNLRERTNLALELPHFPGMPSHIFDGNLWLDVS